MKAVFVFGSLLAGVFAADDKPSKEDGLKHLEEKAQEEGVVKLESGLLYKVLEKGDGMYAPKVGSKCKVTYEGRLINGEKFDGGTTEFAPNQVIKGWTEAMQLMVEGDKFELTIPSDLAYGAAGSPPKIPADSVLVFDMQIHEIVSGGKKRLHACDPASSANCTENEISILAKFKDMSLEDVKATIKQEKARTKKTLKKGEYEEIKQNLDMLKLLKKSLKITNTEL